jgi:hypothetical protein
MHLKIKPFAKRRVCIEAHACVTDIKGCSVIDVYSVVAGKSIDDGQIYGITF